jgi:hypothetical protein
MAKRKVVAIHINPRRAGGACKLHSLPQLSADAGHELPTCKPLLAALAVAEVSLPSEITFGHFRQGIHTVLQLLNGKLRD